VNVNGGETVNGSFKVENIGGSGSLLNWKIVSFPDWGTWYFNPNSGENLTPEDGAVTIQVSVIAPSEKNSKFEGIIKVVNNENPEDYDVIPVTLKTPRNKTIYKTFFDCLKNYQSMLSIIKCIIAKV
jgi:hypothetical protein